MRDKGSSHQGSDALGRDPAEATRLGSDAGKTSGGGSLGHDQPDRVRRETPVRNDPSRGGEPPATSDRRTHREAADPVMPSDDAALKTKI
jgi:hypothetical protein